ncbi:MAG: GIY-YIG nuclease family protein [Candidatus Margulisbacteria bacterium]|nr:GIY-YIG nuclease family protein [Candidatus Margulisiibacteriota bacterium]
MARSRSGTLYIGVTSDLTRRVYDHQQGIYEGFTKKYGVKTLVYYECGTSIESAIYREKQIKKWNCSWKLKLIEKQNPIWRDLSEAFLDSRLHGNDERVGSDN